MAHTRRPWRSPLPVARQCRIPRARPTNDFVRSLGATSVTSGEGLADRIAELAPKGVDAALDTAR